MNQYGRMAQRHWQRNLPQRYGRLPDPEAFFTDLGEQMAQRVEELSDAIAGPDLPGEGYLDKLGRLNRARLSAEEEVAREMLPASDEDQDRDSTLA